MEYKVTQRTLDQVIRSDTDIRLCAASSVYVSDNPPTRSRQEVDDFVRLGIIH